MSDPATYRFQVRQGKAWSRVWTINDRDEDGNVTPLVLTGNEFDAEFSTSEGPVAVTFELEVDDATLDDNQVRLSLTAEQTASMPPGVHDTELDWADSAGRTDTTPDVTLQMRVRKQ